MVHLTKVYDREKFFAKKLTLIGIVGNLKFYEHPTYGDEETLVVDTGDKVGQSDFWELPTLEELAD